MNGIQGHPWVLLWNEWDPGAPMGAAMESMGSDGTHGCCYGLNGVRGHPWVLLWIKWDAGALMGAAME